MEYRGMKMYFFLLQNILCDGKIHKLGVVMRMCDWLNTKGGYEIFGFPQIFTSWEPTKPLILSKNCKWDLDILYFLKTPTSNGKIPRCRNDSNARWSHTDLRDTIFMSSKVSQMIVVDQIPTMNAGVVRWTKKNSTRGWEASGCKTSIARRCLKDGYFLICSDIP